jgi:hypothetical protein
VSALSKIPNILSHLSDQLFRAWSAFLVAKHIDPILEDSHITSIRYFLTAAYVSCFESAILALSKLTIPHGESMNIEYLLNCCEQSPEVFANVDKDEILRSVRAHRQQFEKVKPLIEHVKTWRNKAIAHLDRQYVNDPTSISSIPPIDMAQVEEVFILLEKIINAYRGYLNASELRLSDYKARMAEDWEHLIGAVRQ